MVDKAYFVKSAPLRAFTGSFQHFADMLSVNHQKILPRSNTQLYYNNGGHNNNLKTLRRFHDVDDVTVKDNQ